MVHFECGAARNSLFRILGFSALELEINAPVNPP